MSARDLFTEGTRREAIQREGAGELFALQSSLQWGRWSDLASLFYSSRASLLHTLLVSNPCILRAAFPELGRESGREVQAVECFVEWENVFPPCADSVCAEARIAFLQNALSANGFASAETASLSKGLALAVVSELSRVHTSAAKALIRVIEAFSLPILTASLIDSTSALSPTQDEVKATYGVLTDIVRECHELLSDRVAVSLPPDLVGSVCTLVVHPLMLLAEAQFEAFRTDSLPGDFVYSFCKKILKEGQTSLALSRAVIGKCGAVCLHRPDLLLSPNCTPSLLPVGFCFCFP